MTHAAMSTGAGSKTFEKSVRARLHQAEDFPEQVPGEMVKFAKNGSYVTAAEIKLAWAATGGDRAVTAGASPSSPSMAHRQAPR